MTNPLSFKIKKKFDRYIHDPLVALIILPFFLILKILPYKISSLFCGSLVFLLAPFSKYQKRVMNNLDIAFPKIKKVEKIKISKRFWFNFGQIIGELPHIDKIISSKNIITIGHEKIKNGPAILIGAHLANWEFLLRVGEMSGRRVGFVYRPINNWILNKLQFSRNSKIDADFFRKKTPTPQAAAIMSIKWNVPIFMVRVERINLLRFKLTIENEIKLPKNSKSDDAVYKLTELISKRIEQWIIENPEQWLWAHRRWGK